MKDNQSDRLLTKVWVRATIIGFSGNGHPIVRLEDEVAQKRVAVTKTFGAGLLLDEDKAVRNAADNIHNTADTIND